MEDLNMDMKIRGGIEAIGPHSSSARRYYAKPHKKKSNPKLMHFRVGEVLQGKIISAKGDGTGLVRLPSGDFICQVHEGLLPGDELFFMIISTEPFLTLRVHAVMSFIRGRRRYNNDIVRILDLPDNELFLSASEMYLTFKNMIFKDDLLRFSRFYTRVPNADKYDVDSICRTLFWIAESSLHLEYDIFEMAYSYFDGLKHTEQQMSNLFLKIYPNLSDSFKNLLLPYRRAYYGLDNAATGISFFSKNILGNNLCFLELMNKVSTPQISAALGDIPPEIVKFVESMHIWNSVCTGSEAAYHWTFPFRIRNRTKLLTLVFRSQFNVQKIMNLPAGSGVQHDIDVGNILAQIIERNLEELEKLLLELNDFHQVLPKLEHYFTNNGLTLLALQYFDDKLITLEAGGGAVLSSNKSISFVV